MADYDSSEQESFDDSLNPALVFALLKSSELFPIDFEDAWQWVGYTRKDSAKKKLLNNFTKGIDFQVFRQTAVNSTEQELQPNSGGRPNDVIMLTVDCFKSFAMMAGTLKGKEVRRYFLRCEAELKQRLEKDRQSFVQVDFEQEHKAWQQRYDVRIFLKDCLRPELMTTVANWAKAHGVSPITLTSSVHDTMNQRIQGMRSREIKQANRLSKRVLIRDHFEAPPLIDYAAINKLAKNAIDDRGVEPVQAVHEACDSYLGLAYAPKPVAIIENLHVQGRKLKAARNQKRLSQGQQLSFWDQRSEAS